jgi:catechol 2,3-dioxygenase-like lactoylglutathione lyase family enzyme
MIQGYDHVQIAIPVGGEATARTFYGELLGMSEVPKPAALAVRGGCWFSGGTAMLHLGVEDPFAPARKAHPAFIVSDLDALGAVLAAAGHETTPANEIPGIRRFHAADPFGNRLEFQQS